LALGAQKRFQGEREKNESGLKISNWQEWCGLTSSVRPFFSCLLAHVFRPCMVLHRARQHGSMHFFHSAKQLSKCSFISPSFLFFLQQPSVIEFWILQVQNKLQTTGIDTGAERRMLSFMFDHVSQSKNQTLRPNHTVLRRAALSGAEGRRPVLDGGYLASRLLKHWSLTFDRVTDSLMFNMDCVSNGLGHSWFPVTSYRWKCLACCAHQRLLFQHIHKFLV